MYAIKDALCNKAFMECVDTFDYDTIVYLKESTDDQQTLENLTTIARKIYGLVVNKIDDIDYGTIPNSKGDITKVQNIERLKEVIELMKSYVRGHSSESEILDELLYTIEYLKKNRSKITSKYKEDMLIKITYDNIVLALFSMVNILTGTCIEYVKTPDNNYDYLFDKLSMKDTKSNTVYKSIVNFNNFCRSGKFDKLLDNKDIISLKEDAITGVAIVVGVIGITILTIELFVLVLRELIYLFFYIRQSLSDYFDTISNMIEANALTIENKNNYDQKTKKEIIDKQYKMSMFFKSLSNSLSIANKRADLEVKKEVEKDRRNKLNKQDIEPQLVDKYSIF